MTTQHKHTKEGNVQLCDYCKGIGACPTCWGRSAIEELKAVNAELLEACKILYKQALAEINLEDKDVCGGFWLQAKQAIQKAEGRA